MKNLKYVYRCIKDQREKNQFGLSSERYKKGDFISFMGHPVKDLQEAAIYGLENDFWTEYDEDALSEMNGRNYFEKLNISIQIV